MRNSINFTYTTKINAPIEEVWSFFSSATNLSKITQFPQVNIVSDPRTMEGNKIEMVLSFGWIKMKWVSLIRDVQKPNQFVDDGIKLPFPFIQWSHVHAFSQTGNTTLMEDHVVCQSVLPNFMIKPILNGMFKGREKALHTHFKSF